MAPIAAINHAFSWLQWGDLLLHSMLALHVACADFIWLCVNCDGAIETSLNNTPNLCGGAIKGEENIRLEALLREWIMARSCFTSGIRNCADMHHLKGKAGNSPQYYQICQNSYKYSVGTVVLFGLFLAVDWFTQYLQHRDGVCGISSKIYYKHCAHCNECHPVQHCASLMCF